LLDVRLPDGSGLDVCRQMRQAGLRQPITILTAQREEIDKVLGLEMCSDDYVTKPFGLEELLLRVEARLKHLLNSQREVLEVGPIRLDEDAHQVTVDGVAVELSPTEFRLLQELMQRKGRVATKGALLDSVWGINWDTTVTVLDTYISYLRKKLHTENWQGIKTVRGIGFQIEAGE
jgi:two-component system OmpR family response regulator